MKTRIYIFSKIKTLKKKSYFLTFVYHLVRYQKITSRDFWLLQYYDLLFDERRVAFLQLVKGEPCVDCDSVASFWRICKKINYYNGKPEGISLLRRFLASYNGDIRALKYMEISTAVLILRYSTPVEFVEFMKEVRAFTFQDSVASLLKNLLAKNLTGRWLEHEKELSSFYNITKELTPIDRLKNIVESRLKAENGSVIYDNYIGIEEEFLSLVSEALRREYQELVISRYDVIREQVTLLDIERQESQKNKFLELIRSHLSSGIGFSFIRLSEGEAYLCRRYSKFFTDDDVRNRERHWWGQELPQSLRERVISDGLIAIKNADVIGIPSIYRFLIELKADAITLLSRFQGRGLVTVLEAITYLNARNMIYTDALVSRSLFRTPNDIVDLAESAKSVVIISSVKKEVLNNVFPSNFLFHHVSIPTHFKTSLNGGYESAGQILPYIYEEKCKELRALCSPGTLVFVAAGVAGKVFMNVAKESGAVGLDVGHAINGFVDPFINQQVPIVETI